MIGAIKYNFRHLADFSGRQARQPFWFWVLFLVILQFVVGLLSAIPMYIALFQQGFDTARNAGSEDAVRETMMTGMGEAMSANLGTQVWIGAILALVTAALFLAAFVRRLHDGGFSGLIAAIPLATQIFAAFYAVATMDAMLEATLASLEPGQAANAYALQQEAAPYGWVGYIGYLVVIVFGVWPTKRGANRYGEEPHRD